MGDAMLSKSLIQFSVDGQGYVPSLLFDLWPNYGGGNEDNGDLLKGPVHALLHLVPLTLQQATTDPGGVTPLTPSLETPGHSEASLSQSFVASLFLAPGSWCTQGFACALQESVSPVLCKFCNQIPLASKVKFLGFSVPLPDSQVGKSAVGPRTLAL